MTAKTQARLKAKAPLRVRLLGLLLLVVWMALAWVWSRSIDHSFRYGIELDGRVFLMTSQWGLTSFGTEDRSDFSSGGAELVATTRRSGPIGLSDFAASSATIPRWVSSPRAAGIEMGTAWVATLLLLPTIAYMHAKRKSTARAPGDDAGGPSKGSRCPRCGGAMPAGAKECPTCVTQKSGECDSSDQRFTTVSSPNFGAAS